MTIQNINFLTIGDSFSCTPISKNGKTRAHKRIHAMNTVKKIALTATFALGVTGTVFAQNNLAIINATGATTSVNDDSNKVSKVSFIKYGTTGEAADFSGDNKLMVISLLEGNMDEPYTIEKYALMLHDMFLKAEKPTDVTFFIDKSSEIKTSSQKMPVTAIVYSSGYEMDLNGGDFEEYDHIQIPKNLVPLIDDLTAKHSGNTDIKPKTSASIKQASDKLTLAAN